MKPWKWKLNFSCSAPFHTKLKFVSNIFSGIEGFYFSMSSKNFSEIFIKGDCYGFDISYNFFYLHLTFKGKHYWWSLFFIFSLIICFINSFILFSYLKIKNRNLLENGNQTFAAVHYFTQKITFVSNIFSGIEGFYLSFILACLAKISYVCHQSAQKFHIYKCFADTKVFVSVLIIANKDFSWISNVWW